MARSGRLKPGLELSGIELSDLSRTTTNLENTRPSSAPGSWIDGWRSLRDELRDTRWGRGVLWFLFSVWMAALLTINGFLCTILKISSYLNYSDGACKPDGSFDSLGEGFDAWEMSGFFQITLGFGELNLTEAKLVDIIWDIVGIPQNRRT